MKKLILWAMIALGCLCMVLMLSLGQVTDNLAEAKQAQAVIEANRTAQIATTGLAVNASITSVLLMVMVGIVGLLLAAVAVLIWRDRRREAVLQEMSRGQLEEGVQVQGHVRGLNTGNPYAVRGYTRQMAPGNPVEQLLQLEMMRMLRELRGGQASAPAALARRDDEDVDIRWNG